MTGTPQNARLGILLMIAATLVFSIQDGISRHLGAAFSVMTVVMLRYWFFAAFATGMAATRGGGIRKVARSRVLGLQIFRSVLLVAEIVVTVLSFVLLGLIESHAIFAVYPLLVAALAGPILGEYVGWRRAAAIGVGLIGVLVILRPGIRVFSPEALVPLLGAFMFALYALLTRLAAQHDGAETSFFWTGVAGAAAATLVGPFFWTPIHGAVDIGLMALLCMTGVMGHFLMIRAYSVAEAGTVQPFAYFQLVFITILGTTFFGERPDAWTLAGGLLILAAGLYTILRQAALDRALRRGEASRSG